MASPLFTVIGAPISTFSRSITLGLIYHGIAFEQDHDMPFSGTAYESHPFRFLPTPVIHEIDGKKVDLKLREPQVIARYIDRIAPEPSLNVAAGDMPSSRSRCFPAVAIGVVKPRLGAMGKGKSSDAEARLTLALGVDQLCTFLAKIEGNMSREGYVFGEKLTWANFFLFPLLADLTVLPEGELLSPRLLGWMEKIEQLDAVQKTKPETLSALTAPRDPEVVTK